MAGAHPDPMDRFTEGCLKCGLVSLFIHLPCDFGATSSSATSLFTTEGIWPLWSGFLASRFELVFRECVEREDG